MGEARYRGYAPGGTPLPHAKLLVDGNDGYDLEGILRFVEGVDDSGYLLEAGVLALPDSPGFGMELI